MMKTSSVTPRAMPAVAMRSTPPVSVHAAEARPLTGPVTLVTPAGEHELEHGSILVGRSPDCEIVVEDQLVSRQHARVVIEEQRVWVEDLHSTNGVYVNAALVAHRAALCEGDRILVGTCEISIFARRVSATLAGAQTISTLPPPRTTAARAIELPPSPRMPSATTEALPQTTRAESLRVIGRLASRLAAAQQLDEAERVLSGHLRRILDGASAGLTLSDDLFQLACDHALDLARWTTRGAWLDYVVELHLATRRVMSLELIAGLQLARRWVGEVNRLLLSYYVESLVGRADELELDERRRLPVLQKLAE